MVIRATDDPDKVKFFVFDFLPSKETEQEALDKCEEEFGKNLYGHSFIVDEIIKRSDTKETPKIKFFDSVKTFKRS
jgi:hypothetical protein